MSLLKKFMFILSLPVLSVLYLGLLGSVLFALLAGLLRTFGFEAVKITIWPDIAIPAMFSFPFALLVALLLFFCSIYIKRLLKFVFSNVQ
ncbi:hypothetical protein CEW92_00660 [Bacillaceae bacterium SAS-127]|nr:hypothetical protein CEW92_00660 [Bacillaceae bacterium SAS-127]